MSCVAVMNLYDVTTKSATGIETYVAGPFKVWHIGGIILMVTLSIELFCLLLSWALSMTSDGCSMNLPLFQLVIVCCCMDVRIPRSKQEIEESHRQKHVLANYRQKYLNYSNLGTGLQSDRHPKRVQYDNGKNSNIYRNKCTSQISDRRGRSNYERQAFAETQHSRQNIEDSTPLSRDPTQWLSALNKIGVGGAPIRQQENLVKTLSSLPQQNGNMTKKTNKYRNA